MLFRIIFLLSAIACNSQHKVSARLSAVRDNGLHRILVTPEIRSYSTSDLRDLRIYDSEGIETPYTLITHRLEESDTQFRKFRILSKKIIPNKSTTIVVENSIRKITEITLNIANSEVTKTYSISGSNDQIDWFGLVNGRQLIDVGSSQETSEYITIPLPLSAYRYLKIIFDDKKTLPLNILKAGYYETLTHEQAMLEVVPDKINFLVKGKTTLIPVAFNKPQIIDRVEFDVAKPSFYKRSVRIYKNSERRIRKKKKMYHEDIAICELSSASENDFDLRQIFEKEFFIEIDNLDSRPLDIKQIKFYQIPVYVIAELKKGEKYTISTGDEELAAPRYDLSYFGNDITGTYPNAEIGKAVSASLISIPNQNRHFWQKPWFMWICILVAGVGIAYFSLSLVKEIK